MPKPIITPEIVIAASSGDPMALETVANFFHSYIKKLCTRPFYDEYGNKCDLVDEALRKHIESRLMSQIICHFDPNMVLKGEELTEK